ncbi:TIGR01906 family membrane protein [Kocuria sp. JC486]|nr:TIGR01906 family membrane protein [Kocuria sp. JC486]
MTTTGDSGPHRAARTEPDQGNEWSRLGPAVARTHDDVRSSESPAGRSSSAPAGAESSSTKLAPVAGSTSSPWADGNGSTESSTMTSKGRSSGPWQVLSRLIVGLAVPLGLLALSVRLVASPLFLWIEYHRPGFPSDEYGFDAGERMSLGSQGVDYILNWAPPSFLGDVRTANGVPWFTSDEVSHMTDVKGVLQVGLGLALVTVLLAALFWLLRHRKDATGLIRAAVWGAWGTLLLLAVLVVLAVLGWSTFFAEFHSLFFADGTWTFSASDTLIRLYPTQFWIDAAASVAALTVLGCLVVIVSGYRSLRRRRKAVTPQR